MQRNIISIKITFLNEFRLFIANNKIFGLIESSSFLLDNHKIVSIKPDQLFLDKVLKYNTYQFCIIDIGFEKETNNWAIVEVNPFYALSSYDFAIDKYFEFCKLA